MAAALAVPATAGAKVLIETYNEGLEPHVVLEGTSEPIDNPKRITVSFTANHKAELVGSFAIKCTRTRRHSYSVSGLSPAARTVRIRSHAGKCRVVAAEARLVDPFDEGWIQLRATGSG